MDWLDLLAVQGTLKSLLQHHSSKASILWCPALFIVQLSHPYMTTGETIALTRWTFVGKVLSLLFNMLSRLVITFLPRSKHLFPSPADLPNPGIEPRSLTFQADSLPAEPQGKPKNTEVGSLSLLQQIFLTQEWNRGLLHCKQILYQLRYQGSPVQRKGAGNQVVCKVLSLCWKTFIIKTLQSRSDNRQRIHTDEEEV